MLTMARCKALATWTLSNSQTPYPIEPEFLVNLSGRALCSAYEWNFLKRTLLLDGLASSEFLTLPAEVRSVLAIRPSTVGVYNDPCTPEEIIDARSVGSSPTTLRRWAITYGADGQPVVEVWPPFTVSTPAAFRAVIRAQWINVTDENASVPLPEWIEPLLLAYLQATARGMARETDSPLIDRYQAVRESLTFREMVAIDGGVQRNFGVLGPDDEPSIAFDLPEVLMP